MKRGGYQQKSAMGGRCEEEERKVMESVVCPKPRRFGLLNPLKLPICHQTEMGDSRAGSEMLDMILTKGGGYGGEKHGYQVASSPPFYSGSPPSRASNPLILDARFGNEKLSPLSNAPPSPSSSAARKGGGGGGGCVRVKFGQKPAAVRIEGFDCLSRDRQSCSISAVA